MIYKIFWIGYGLAAAGVLLHIFHILVPFLNIDPRMYAEIKADSEMRTDFHKRHLLYGILILFCIAGTGIPIIPIWIRIISDVIGWGLIVFEERKDQRILQEKRYNNMYNRK